MAISFQYNKTSLNQLNKQLKIRIRALPILKNKESALRAEVKRAKDIAEKLENGRKVTNAELRKHLKNLNPESK